MDNSIKQIISKIVSLERCKNNHKIYFSRICPFCGENGIRPFRYNTKLKVGKAYCCGVSFKDISWLKIIISDRDRYEIKMIQDDILLKDEDRQYLIDKYFKDKKDKLSMKENRFEKSDYNLPF